MTFFVLAQMLPDLQDVDTPFRHWSFLSFNPRSLALIDGA
jgi:hypothetical protein